MPGHTEAVRTQPDDRAPAADVSRRAAAGPPPGVPDDYEATVAMERSFDALYGLELVPAAEQDGEGAMRGRVAIRDELRQQAGILHGGVLAAMAEALASWGTWRGAAAPGIAVMGMSNDTSFLRPFVDGHVTAVATPVHRGRTRWLWEVRHHDDQGRLGAVTMVNIAIRPRRAGA